MRQTISFSTAMATKNSPKRKVSLRHPSSSIFQTAPKSGFSSGFPKARPPSSTAAMNAFTRVGFILMKVSSASSRVSPPNTATSPAVTSGRGARRRSKYQETPSMTVVAAMIAAVAHMMPAA